ncbi:disease resistance protein RPM1-like [Phragmites australis]|uniref:disease resistance protein RPM1-like n=1 Tax=Phragmites australis TaxID=29695 RepID=UPI002D765C47|nr:disease resistance protein RPM1-like [Phragmites australis]
MEATALSLAKLALDTLLPVAKNALADEAMLLLGVHEEVSFITNELEMMQAFLRVAGADHRANNEVVKIWVKQVRDLAYDVEDCLQEYLALDLGAVGCDLPPFARCLRACAVTAAGRLRTQHHIAVRIRQMKGRVEEVSKRNLRYNIVVQPVDPTANPDIIEHLALDPVKFAADIATEESQLVGRDQSRAELVDRLVGLPSSAPLQVLPVWGMGGVGKTVFARDVLKSPKLGQAFHLRAWVTVQHPFVMAEFLSSLASQLEMEASRSLLAAQPPALARATVVRQRGAANALPAEVVRHLGGRRYAIVVDDVSTISEWEQIKKFFLDRNMGSWIIVTTRDEDVAIHCSTSSRHVYPLNSLSHKESFQLLCKKAQMNDGQLMAELMEKADPILQRCCGLPLAIAAVGKLLSTKMKTPVEWKKLHDHLGSELKGNPGLEEIKNVLTSSYDGLPYHLKSCFLYLSIFPKYRELRQTRVSWRWMAEGLVQESSGKDPGRARGHRG